MRQNLNLDPKKFRKHSDIVAVATREIAGVTGDRVQTVYGFHVVKASCKPFTVLYMSFVDGASTPIWEHAKKIRTYTVATGSGYFVTTNADGEEEFKHIANGDTVIASPKQAHRLKSRDKLVLLCTQEDKYEVNLTEVAVDQLVDVDLRDLVSIKDTNQVAVPRRTSNTKTIDNMRERRGQKPVERVVSTEDAFRATAVQGVNARPLTFNEDSAG